MMFGEIPPSGLGGDVIQRLTDDGHPMITIAHIELKYGSGELRS